MLRSIRPHQNFQHSSVLPKASSEKELAEKFLLLFKKKIEKIRASFKPSETDHHSFSSNNRFNGDFLYTFDPTSAEEVRNIVSAHGIKCSPEDPVPAKLLSANIDLFVPFWVEIVNLSLEYGDMDGLKSAVLIPLIKDLSSTVDREDFKNYRPVSNLPFVSKIVERVVQIRLERHMIKNDLIMSKNFGYRKNYSTEMLLLKVIDEKFKFFDRNVPTVVILLDLGAALTV